MKKIILVSLVMLMAATAFAQDVNLYGAFRLDYDVTKTQTETDPINLGGFNVARARLGVKWKISDEVKAKVELDVFDADYELRKAEFSWAVAEAVTITGGRMSEAFASESAQLGKRFDGVGVGVDFGMGEFVLQFGNDKGKADGKANTALTIMPAVVLTPEIEGLGLEVGVNGKLNTPAEATSKDLVAHANIYAIAEVADLAVTVNSDFNNLVAPEGTDLDVDLNADINYSIDKINVGVAGEFENLTDKLAAGIELYAKVKVASGLKLIPIVALSDLTENEMDYKITLRFEWKPSYDF